MHLQNWSFVSEIFQRTDQQSKICLYHSKLSAFGSINMVSVFNLTPPGDPCALSFSKGEKYFLTKAKISHVLTNFSPPGIQILIKIRTEGEYFTLCELFDAKNSAGTPQLFAGQSICNLCLRQNYNFLYILVATTFLFNTIITAISCKTV